MTTYQVTGYEAYVRERDEPLTSKFTQYIGLYVRSTANTQGTYDFASYVAGSLGTFWTAAIADTTAINVNVNGVLTATTVGALATSALQLFQSGAPALANSNFLSVTGPFVAVRGAVGSGSATSGQTYGAALANGALSLTIASGDAPTASTYLLFTWDLPPGNHGIMTPVTYS